MLSVEALAQFFRDFGVGAGDENDFLTRHCVCVWDHNTVYQMIWGGLVRYNAHVCFCCNRNEATLSAQGEGT